MSATVGESCAFDPIIERQRYWLCLLSLRTRGGNLIAEEHAAARVQHIAEPDDLGRAFTYLAILHLGIWSLGGAKDWQEAYDRRDREAALQRHRQGRSQIRFLREDNWPGD